MATAASSHTISKHSTSKLTSAKRSAAVSFGDYDPMPSRPSDQKVDADDDADRTREVFRVLAVLDGTRESSRLLDYLIGLHDQLGILEVVMIHCYHPGFWGQIGRLTSNQRNVLGERTKKSRQFASRRLAAAGIKHSHRTILGDPADMIMKQLAEHDIEMLLLAGRGDWSISTRALSHIGLTLDGLPSRIMRRTDVPVCVVK